MIKLLIVKGGTNMEFNQLIKTHREKLDLTQEALAELLNVTTTTIQNWERGQNQPTLSNLKPIANALNLNPLQLGNSLIGNENDQLSLDFLETKFKWEHLLPTTLNVENIKNVCLNPEEVEILKVIRLFNLFETNPISELIKTQPDYNRLLTSLNLLESQKLFVFKDSYYKRYNTFEGEIINIRHELTDFGIRVHDFIKNKACDSFNLFNLNFHDFLWVASEQHDDIKQLYNQITSIERLVNEGEVVLSSYSWEKDDNYDRYATYYWKKVIFIESDFIYEEPNYYYGNEENKDTRIPSDYFEIIQKELTDSQYLAEKEAYLKKKDYYDKHFELIEGLTPPSPFEFLYEEFAVPTQKAIDFVAELNNQ